MWKGRGGHWGHVHSVMLADDPRRRPNCPFLQTTPHTFCPSSSSTLPWSSSHLVVLPRRPKLSPPSFRLQSLHTCPLPIHCLASHVINTTSHPIRTHCINLYSAQSFLSNQSTGLLLLLSKFPFLNYCFQLLFSTIVFNSCFQLL